MKEKRKSYRDRYFEDYKAVKVPADNRKGYRVEYQYIGIWTKWENPSGTLKSTKQKIALMEAVSIAVYAAAVLSGTPLSCSRLANGFGTLSLVPWILELSGVIRFIISPEYAKELSMEEISTSIRTGSVMRFALAFLSAAAGGIQILCQGKAVFADLPVFIGIMASSAITLLVRREYNNLFLTKYRNENGRPGSSY